MDFRLLGPLEVLSHGEPLPLGGPKQRGVLALLLLHPNEVVATDTMIDELWGERPPKNVDAFIQNCISRLRKVLGRERIETRAPGYLLRVEPASIDAVAFERAVEAAAGLDAAERAAALREALALWRGAPLADFAFEAFAQPEISRLDELRLGTLEQRLQAELELGHHDTVLGEIEALVRRHPSRERLRELQLLALYRAGRQRDALRAYQEARLELVEEYGLEPGEALRSLERMIIAHDPALQPATVVPADAPAELTRTAVVLMLEIGAADEAMREELATFLAETAVVVERHEGSVRELGTDETVAVFGAPAAHDDDTLRALRAAHELRDAAPQGVVVRAAIERTEDVGVAGDLLARAAGGDVIIGPVALRLAPAAVDVVPHESGRGFRILRFDPAAEPILRHLDAPLVGREAELARLEAAFDAVAAGTAVSRVVVVGDAGIGKTRLALELVARVEARATVLTGRCAPYGDAAALLPLHQILDQIGPLDAALAAEDDAGVIASRLHDRSFADRSEAFWALRRLFEAVATTRPVLIVLEDAHWAAPVLLDFVEYLAGWASGAILLLCSARPDLLETRPEWRDDALVLQPLRREDAEALVAAMPNAPDDVSTAVEAGEGNPLFLEQLVAFAAEEGDAVPPTLDVLIRSRVDRLPEEERAVLERASVAGRHFWRSTVEAASDDETRGQVGAALMALVRRRLVHPEPATIAGEDGFRFHHALIRESVYAGIDEATRSRLHESVARALDARGGVEVDEIVGYHLEQAARIEPSLADEAGRRLGAAGVRAMRRVDAHAAVNLLTRALPLVGDSQTALDLECALGTAVKFAGDITRANAILDAVAGRAAAISDTRVECLARVEQVWSSLSMGAVSPDEALRLLRRARGAFGGDDFALARALHLEGAVEGVYHYRQTQAEALGLQALDHYRRANATPLGALTALAVAACRGRRPVDDAIEYCRSILLEAGTPVWASFILPPLAALEAMLGHFDVARTQLEEARRARQEFSDTGTIVTSWSAFAADVELLAGDPQRAEDILERSCATLRAVDDREWLATNSALLGDALSSQGRFGEALAAADAALAVAPPAHLTSRSIAGRVRAVALARLGRDDARRVATETLTLVAGTDVLNEVGAAFAAAAEVHALAGAAGEADEYRATALTVFQQKGNVVAAERVRGRVTAAT